MKPELFKELRKILNEIAHGAKPPEPNALMSRLAELGLSIPAAAVPKLVPAILNAFAARAGLYEVPRPLLEVLGNLLQGRSANVVCDPWAGLGAVLAVVREVTQAPKAFAFTENEAQFILGRILVGDAKWQLGDPLELLNSMSADLDVVASILPFGAKSDRSVVLPGIDGTPVELRDDFGNLILAAAAARLSNEGVGFFVVLPSFFFSQRSVLRQLPVLGFSVEAALALPSGSFAPYTNIETFLVVVRKNSTSRMFVAQLSSDTNTNLQILANFKEGKEGGRLELGRFIDPLSFKGLDSIRLAERLHQIGSRFGTTAVRLEELATVINLGRFGDDFKFPQQENAIFIPLIGISNVVESLEDFTLKPQNYAQVAIDPTRSNARFVAGFLNSEFGKEIRELSKSGAVIPKLNKQSLKDLTVFVPDLPMQKTILEIEARIAAEQNTFLGLQNELGVFHRELWTSPRSAPDVNQRLAAFSSRLSGNLKRHAAERLDQWFETLPFPLASILRAWQATSSQDFKTKHEHLLHFFEASAEFVSVIFLSAFSSNEALFAAQKQKMLESMRRQNLSFQRATFGTWKLVVEYLGKQTRQLLSGDKDARALCADIFSDPSLALPETLSGVGLAAILSTTNKMRNDWSGHGGVVGQEEAQLRNEQLLSEVQKLREAMAEMWTKVQLIHALHCRPRRGVFENEVAVLIGSNSEFLTETRSMATWLDVERLYLCNEDSGRALKLLPLIQVGPTPPSAKNACYFFNRLERDGSARFISYHFIDRPELRGRFDEAMEAIRMFTEF